MDSEKKAHVIELIKKSLQLSIPDEEIIATLVDANLSKEDAEELIKEAKFVKKPIIEEKKELFDESSKDLSLGDQISKQLGLETDEFGLKVKSTNEEVKSQEKRGLFSKFKNKNEEKNKFIENVENKEKESSKGDINTQIENEIFEISKSNTESSDDDKSEENVSKNVGIVEKPNSEKKEVDFLIGGLENQMKNQPVGQSKKILYEMQNKMGSGKSSDSGMEELWKKGIVVAVNSKLNEMKKLKDEIDSLISEKIDSAIKKEINQFKVLLESQKGLIISSNKEALEQKQKEITFIIDSKISEIKKQSDDLNKQIETMENFKKSQDDDLEEISRVLTEAKKTKSQLLVEMNSELIKSKSQAQEFMDKSEKHMQELDSRINKTLELEKNIAEGMLEEVEQKIENLTMTKANDLLEELEVELNKLKTIEKNINIESVEQKVRILDQFKKEFLNSMEANLSKINGAINELNERNEQVSKELEAKSLAIDAKIEELSRFEKVFTDNLEKVLKQNRLVENTGKTKSKK